MEGCIYVSSLAYMQVANMLAVKKFLQKMTCDEPRPNMLTYVLKITHIFALQEHPNQLEYIGIISVQNSTSF